MRGLAVSARFQELDWRRTSLGELILRRRWDPTVDKEVYEIKLDDEFLMSSLFTVAEEEMARLALAELAQPPGSDAAAGGTSGRPLDVVVGGLGLGYTARTVLESPEVGSLLVIEALGEVIEWHENGLIPAGPALTSDPRCRLIHGDFFAMVDSPEGLDPASPDRRFHAVIVDIDHSPRHLLDSSHAGFYRPSGLRRLADRIQPGGVFALWSNDPPDETFSAALAQSFAEARSEVVGFHNPLQGRQATNTVYLARTETSK